MQVRFLLPCFVFVLIIPFASSCTYIGPHAVTYTNQYGNPEGEVAEGEACSKKLFGIFTWGNSSEEAALADARISNAEDVSHMTFSRKISQYLIFSKDCILVRAHMAIGMHSAVGSKGTKAKTEVKQSVKITSNASTSDSANLNSSISSNSKTPQNTNEGSIINNQGGVGIQSASSESLTINVVSDENCQKRCIYVVQYFMRTATLTRDQRKILMSSCNEKCERSADYNGCMMAKNVLDENIIRTCWAIVE